MIRFFLKEILAKIEKLFIYEEIAEFTFWGKNRLKPPPKKIAPWPKIGAGPKYWISL